MKTFLCIDAGTTKVKAALTTLDSNIIDTASRNVKVSMPSAGVCEINMEELWDTLCQVIEDLYINNESLWNTICGVGVCAQGDGAWLIDEDGMPVRPAILWNDTRPDTIPQDELNSINNKCVELNTIPLFSGAFPVILNWVKRNEEENYKRIRWVLHCKDWINYRLTGKIATDLTDGSTAVFDIFNKEYRLEILDWLNIGEMKCCLPEVFESTDIIGGISIEASQRTRIPEGTPVIAGALDILSAATGNNLVQPGQKGSIVGTTLGNFVVLNEEDVRKKKVSVGSILCHTQRGMYIQQMSALSGASAMDWIKEVLADDMDYPSLESRLQEVPIGSNGIVFLPYLFGERAPFRAPNASALFQGLRVNHTKYDIIRAGFEGVAMALYDCYENLPKGEKVLNISGGASRSSFVCQMICDCIGETVVRNEAKELGILGVSKLLQRALGINTEVKSDNLTKFYPNFENHKKYMEVYKKYLKYKNLMMPEWQSK